MRPFCYGRFYASFVLALDESQLPELREKPRPLGRG